MVVLVSTAEVGARLGISERQAQRLVRAGRLERVGIDRIDYASVVHLMAQRRGDHHRVWNEQTAWAAIAILSGLRADWLGQAQRSRLKTSLRSASGSELARKLRNRAAAHRLRGHPAAVGHLASEVVQAGAESAVGNLVSAEGRLDGYVSTSRYEGLVDQFRLEDDWDGAITLRTTSFDIGEVSLIAGAGDVLAGVDLAGSLDTREQSAGVRILDQALANLRG
jgi:hypothetical protein